MDNEEFESNATPRTRRTKSATKAASHLKKFVTRRLAKSISSERDTRSLSSSENAPTAAFSKRFSLRKHKSGKSRQTSLSERDSKAEGPRRSLSVSDMTQIDNEANPEGSPVKLAAIEKEVKVPEFEYSEQFVRELLPKGEGFTAGPVPPDTPVPEQRQENRADARSSSSVHVTFADDENHVAGRKAATDEQPPMEIVDSPDELEMMTDAHMEALIAEKVMEIGALEDSPRAAGMDGHAEITESEIKEAMVENFVAGHEQVEEAAEPVSEMLIAATEASTHEAPDDDSEALEQIEDLVDTTEKKTVKTRDFDLADLAKMQGAAESSPPETQEVTHDMTLDEAESAAAAAAAIEQPLGKPRRRRRRMRIIKSASVSVAALAVGLLIMILKK